MTGRQGWATAAAAALLWALAVEASNTYRPRFPPRFNKAFLTGEKLWKSKRIVGRGGKTCAECHDARGGLELEPQALARKREDLAKLVYFELASHSGNSDVRPDGPEVRALEAYLVGRFDLDAQPLESGEEADVLATARELYLRGDYDAALAALDEILAGAPSAAASAQAHLLRGVIAHVLGDTDRARSEFTLVLAIEPDWKLDPEVFSPKTVELFESVRAALARAPEREE